MSVRVKRSSSQDFPFSDFKHTSSQACRELCNSRYGSYLVFRKSRLYFRITVPSLLRDIICMREFKRSLCMFSHRDAFRVALILGNSMCIVFSHLINLSKKEEIMDRNALGSIAHRVLNVELDRLKKLTVDKLSAGDVSEVDMRSYFGTVAYNLATNQYSEDSVDFGMSIVRSALSGGVNVPEDISSDIRELLGEVDSSVLEHPRGVRTDKDLNDTQLAKRSQVYELAQAMVKSRAIAYGGVCHDLSVSENTRKKAHDDLNDFCPQPISEGDSAPQISGSLLESGVSITAQEMIRTVVETVGVTLPSPVALGEAVDAYKQSIYNDSIKYPSGLDPAKRRAIDEFVIAFGSDVKTTNIQTSMIEKYINLLHCFPSGLELAELRNNLWSYLDAPHDGRTMQDGTVKTRLINLRCFFRDMRKRNYIGQDLLDMICSPLRDRISLIEKRASVEKSERPFEIDELKLLFEPNSYLAWSSLHAADYWLPLLALFTGARMGELVTLRAMDIKLTPAQPFVARRKDKSRSGIIYIDLTDSEKNLKTEISHRVVPIHSALLELGFMQYVSDFSSESYLFPHYLGKDNDDKRAVKKMTKEFTEYRRRRNIGREENQFEGDRLNFHTFRHTVIVGLKDQGVDDLVNREIVGHVAMAGKKDAHDQNYGQRYSIEKLYDDGICKLDCFAEQLRNELTGLASSPWAKCVAHRGKIPSRRPRY